MHLKESVLLPVAFLKGWELMNDGNANAKVPDIYYINI